MSNRRKYNTRRFIGMNLANQANDFVFVFCAGFKENDDFFGMDKFTFPYKIRFRGRNDVRAGNQFGMQKLKNDILSFLFSGGGDVTKTQFHKLRRQRKRQRKG